jgi:hypothetical protein
MIHHHEEEEDGEEDIPQVTDDSDRVRELTVRGGSYVLLFLTFAPLAAVTILQIPTDVVGSKYMIHPSKHVLDALKAWMVAVIPIFGSILPSSELLQHVIGLDLPKSLKVAKILKIILIWTGAIICIYGIMEFLRGL